MRLQSQCLRNEHVTEWEWLRQMNIRVHNDLISKMNGIKHGSKESVI